MNKIQKFIFKLGHSPKDIYLAANLEFHKSSTFDFITFPIINTDKSVNVFKSCLYCFNYSDIEKQNLLKLTKTNLEKRKLHMSTTTFRGQTSHGCAAWALHNSEDIYNIINSFILDEIKTSTDYKSYLAENPE